MITWTKTKELQQNTHARFPGCIPVTNRFSWRGEQILGVFQLLKKDLFNSYLRPNSLQVCFVAPEHWEGEKGGIF